MLAENKKYVVYIALELLFTQYWLVSLVIFALGSIVYNMKKNDNSISVNCLDSITTIAIIILAVAML